MTGIQTENTTGAVVEEGGLSEVSLAEIAVSPGNVTTDANGNITEIVMDDGTYSFSFDYENRLIEARYPDGLVFEFEYDGLGRRVLTRVNGEGVRYIYDGYNIIQERDERTDALIAEYTYFQGNVFKQKRGTEERWFYNQPEGGYPNHVFGVDGAKTDSLDFSWFGEVGYHRGSTDIGFGWAGGWVFAQGTDMPFVLLPESNEIWLPKLAKSLNPLVRSSWSLDFGSATGLDLLSNLCDTPVRKQDRPSGDVPDILPEPIRGPNQPGLTTDVADSDIKLTDAYCGGGFLFCFAFPTMARKKLQECIDRCIDQELFERVASANPAWLLNYIIGKSEYFKCLGYFFLGQWAAFIACLISAGIMENLGADYGELAKNLGLSGIGKRTFCEDVMECINKNCFLTFEGHEGEDALDFVDCCIKAWDKWKDEKDSGSPRPDVYRCAIDYGEPK